MSGIRRLSGTRKFGDCFLDPAVHPRIVKTDCVVLDFGMATIVHGTSEQTVDRDAGLAAAACRAAGTDTNARAKPCPECAAQVPLAAAEWPFCGAELIEDVARVLNFERAAIDLFDRSNFA